MVIGGNVDFSFSDISGGIWLTVFPDSHRTAMPIWRTFVYGILNFSHARVGVLYLDGCHIDSSIWMIEMRARSIYARCSAFPSVGKSRGLYRSWIGGAFQASGVVIENVIEMEGAWVDGEFQFITGRCGRLKLTLAPWWKNESPQLTHCEAHGLALVNFTIDRSVHIAGLCLSSEGLSQSWSEGGVLTHDLRIGGSLLFWHPEQSKRLEQNLRKVFDGNPSGIKAEIEKVLAKLPGSINLEGARINGTVNLGRTLVEGSIDLANAHVGGSIVAVDKGSSPHILTCKALNARNMQVGDDADLRGLSIQTNDQGRSINLEGAHVDGNINLRGTMRGVFDLTNAHVGDSLLVFDQESSSRSTLPILVCSGLNARNMQIGGDIDLRGLKVVMAQQKSSPNSSTEANVNLQDVEVGGILRLATPEPKVEMSEFKPAVSVENGGVDLTGVHASQIILSGKSITSDYIEHGFALTRCKVDN